jgi:hypothetical protein
MPYSITPVPSEVINNCKDYIEKECREGSARQHNSVVGLKEV